MTDPLTPPASGAPRTDVVSRSIESDGMLLTNRGAVSLDQAHDFAASAVKKMTNHARQLERELQAERQRCEAITNGLSILARREDKSLPTVAEAEAYVQSLRQRCGELEKERKPYYLKVGKYAIGNHPAGGYWLEHESGEGMQGGAHFEEVIDEYFKRNF